MSTTQQKILDIEDEIRKTKKNKATETHLGLLKAKLAKLKRELIDNAIKGSGGGGEGFEVSKSGDARIGLVGRHQIDIIFVKLFLRILSHVIFKMDYFWEDTN